MCMTCTTTFDSITTNLALGAVVASNLWTRVRDRQRGISRLERDLMTWEQNAEFVRSLGLDPLGTLGAPPTVPAVETEAAPVASPALVPVR